tara:strand:+ start:406 stop:3525 length:3120 start_codon:yes stop_codon:yes gene_type:complete
MITVQILDYVYGSGANNQLNFNNATVNTSATYPWQQLSSTSAKIVNQITGTKYLYPVSGLMTKGQEYTISATVVDYTGSGGDIGFSSGDSSGTANGVGNTARRSSNGDISHTFDASGFQDVKIFSDVNGGGTLTNCKLTPTSSIDWKESVLGNLDVGSSEDFPLALTFSIADARNLDNRTGTYSKSFKIPATKNNNKILKSSYIEGSTSSDQSEINFSNNVNKKKPCRIIVDGNYSVDGFFQLTAIGKSTSPSYYSCVFYGDNIDWASSLDTKPLKDLSVLNGADGSGWDSLNGKTGTGIDLKVQYQYIIDTWDAVDAENTQPSGGAVSANTSPIVYPIISYGENNAGGEAATIQLLTNKHQHDSSGAGKVGYYGWDNSNNSYDTPIPSCDWRPCIFIYDIIKQIFSQEGYTIVSDFIETTMFKKLIMALPNFKHNNVVDRVNANSWEGGFDSAGSGLAYSFLIDGSTTVPVFDAYYDPSVWQTVYQDIKWDDGGQLVETVTEPPTEIVYDNATGSFTINEFGFYDISVSNLSVWIESVCYLPLVNTATDVRLKTIRVGCYVKTAGQSSWNKIGDFAHLIGEDDDYIKWATCGSTPSGYPASSFNSNQLENMLIENQYLNKGDKIKFQVLLRAQQGTGIGHSMGFETYIYGGDNSTGAPAGGSSNSGGVISIIHKGENVAYGQTYDLKNVIDSSSTQMGFLKGVSHAFNLQFLTDTVSKTVEIEPFNDFYKNQNDAIDWTGKVDLSQNQEDKWIETELLREVIFKYKTDSEDKVVEDRGIKYWDSILDEYPYREFLSNEFSVGQVIFENPFFAGTRNTRNSQSNLGWNANAPYGAVLWGFCDTYNEGTIPTGGSGCRPEKGYNFVPRLLNWERLQCSSYVSTAVMLYAVIQDWASSTETIWSAYGVPFSTFEIYPQATSFNKFDSSVPVLTYNSISILDDRNCLTGAITSADTQKGLYQTYYQNQVEMMKNSPRIKAIYINLTLSDASNLDLRKLVYIDGSYYRINRVIDFQPNNNKTTKVELVLWEDLGSFEASPATF